mgnify:CR=1 FL=1
MKKCNVLLVLLVVVSLLCVGCTGGNDGTASSGAFIQETGAAQPTGRQEVTQENELAGDKDKAEGKAKIGCALLSVNNAPAPMSESGFAFGAESKYWNGKSFTSDTAQKERLVDFCEKTYTGAYRFSRYDSYHSFATDYYGNKGGVEFGVHSQNGKLVYINFKTTAFFEKEAALADVSDIAEEAPKIARSYAKQFINVDEYTALEPHITDYQPDAERDPLMTLRTYTFAKTINGMKSSDFISVQVTSKGHLASVVVGDIYAYADDVLLTMKSFGKADIEALVNGQIKKMAGLPKSAEPSVEEMCCAVSPEGEPTVCVRASCAYRGEDGEEDVRKIGFEFVVK